MSTNAEPGRIADVRERIDDLRRLIERANYEYYTLNQPTISDSEYDSLVDELEELELRHPEFASPDSPTAVVGPPPGVEFKLVEHLEPLLGLNNAYNLDELAAWDRRVKDLLSLDSVEYVVELKIDGLAVALRYEHGELVMAATRGDGVRGENVTENIRTISSVPQQIDDAPGLVEVRTEVYMPHKGFYQLNEERTESGQPTFANPRNAAAGAVRQQNPAVTAARPLDLFAFGISSAKDLSFSTHWEALNRLHEWGFPVNPNNELHDGLESVSEYCKRWQTGRDRLRYDTDGVVVKVNNLNAQERLGSIFRAPRWAVAYKFPPVEATTVVRSIFMIVGREGSVIPYASVEPVTVGGATLSVIPLHNEDYIRKKDIRIGERVVVRRAGDIRPQIVKSLPELRTGSEQVFEWPTHCPACGTPISRQPGEAAWKCPNPECVGKLYQKIKQFVSEQAMDIRGIGDALAGQLAGSGKVRDAADIYYLTREDWLDLGLTPRKTTNLTRALERSRDRDLSRLIFGIGIADIGLGMAKRLAAHFQSLDDLISASLDELQAVQGVGKKTAEAIRGFFDDLKNWEMIEKLRTARVNFGRV